MAAPWGQPGPPRQGRLPPFGPVFAAKSPAATPRWLIILNLLRLSNDGRFPHSHRCSMRSLLGTSGQRIPPRCLRGLRRHPRLHHRQPGRRLRRRPVPGQGRKMRRACRPRLLPVTRFCPGHRPTAASIPTRSPARFPKRPTQMSAMAVATNTSPSPASADSARPADLHGTATPPPPKRRDDAAGSGYGERLGRAVCVGRAFG